MLLAVQWRSGGLRRLYRKAIDRLGNLSGTLAIEHSEMVARYGYTLTCLQPIDCLHGQRLQQDRHIIAKILDTENLF